MTFTIPPFWLGVIVTIFAEGVALAIASIRRRRQTKRGNRSPWNRK